MRGWTPQTPSVAAGLRLSAKLDSQLRRSSRLDHLFRRPPAPVASHIAPTIVQSIHPLTSRTEPPARDRLHVLSKQAKSRPRIMMVHARTDDSGRSLSPGHVGCCQRREALEKCVRERALFFVLTGSIHDPWKTLVPTAYLQTRSLGL